MSGVIATRVGAPVWLDAMVPTETQLGELKAFYTGLFGWGWDHGSADTGHYSIARVRGRAVMGLSAREPGTGALLTYFATRDAAADVARDDRGAEDAGPRQCD